MPSLGKHEVFVFAITVMMSCIARGSSSEQLWQLECSFSVLRTLQCMPGTMCGVAAACVAACMAWLHVQCSLNVLCCSCQGRIGHIAFNASWHELVISIVSYKMLCTWHVSHIMA
jgi:hypothetical protein